MDNITEKLVYNSNLPCLYQPVLNGSTLPNINSPEWIQIMSAKIIQELELYGLCVIDSFLGEEEGSEILNEVISLHGKGLLKKGRLVVNKGESERNIRGDFITWINENDSENKHICYLLHVIDSVILMCSQTSVPFSKNNIKGRTKAMVACYPGKGTSYVKHVDNPNKDGRCITVIYYLNKDWDVKIHGGLLRIFPEFWNDQVADIAPIFDRLILFWSDRRNPHEVQASYKVRYAITTWFYNEEEHNMAKYKIKKNGANIQ